MACISRAGGDQETKAMLTSAGYCFSDASSGGNQSLQPQVVSQFQSYEPNQEIYGLTSGMELIGFPPKNLHQASERNSVMWKEFFGKSGGGGASTSKGITEQEFYQQDFMKPDFSTGISDTANESLMAAATNTDSAAWHHHHDNRADHHVLLDDPSLGSCVLRPNQGLSLSLGSSNPARIGLQSVELRQTDDNISFANHPSSSRDGGFFGKSVTMHPQQQQQQQLMQDQFLGKAENFNFQNQFQIRSSKYLGPAQELLNEFCNLGSKQLDGTPRLKLHKSNQWEDQEDANSSAKMQSLYSLDLLELQKRKAKLLQMLEEVDRRYKHYRNQMRAVVSSFEAVAGNGAATVYSTLASKAMSRHFRCLRDGIVGQLKATKKALGEKDTSAPGATRGETPRLRIVDQALRQQRAFQQMSMMESHPWRPQRGLPERAVSVLRAWLFEHFLHPYPSDVDKHILARQTGLSRSQVSNWFINARVRLWKPMVEEMYVEEAKEQENMGSSSDNLDKAADENVNITGRQNQNTPDQDQKPTHEQLVRIDSECLSSIINNPEKNDANKSLQDDHQEVQELQQQQQNNFGRVSDPFGAVEFDFASYNHNGNNVGGGNGGGVSLTLGLQQHGGGGMSLAFSPAGQNSLFYSREHIEDCPSVQYSILDSETQNLPYRNLMGAQLLHDFAG